MAFAKRGSKEAVDRSKGKKPTTKPKYKQWFTRERHRKILDEEYEKYKRWREHHERELLHPWKESERLASRKKKRKTSGVAEYVRSA